jgi:hypothetical protein
MRIAPSRPQPEPRVQRCSSLRPSVRSRGQLVSPDLTPHLCGGDINDRADLGVDGHRGGLGDHSQIGPDGRRVKDIADRIQMPHRGDVSRIIWMIVKRCLTPSGVARHGELGVPGTSLTSTPCKDPDLVVSTQRPRRRMPQPGRGDV